MFDIVAFNLYEYFIFIVSFSHMNLEPKAVIECIVFACVKCQQRIKY